MPQLQGALLRLCPWRDGMPQLQGALLRLCPWKDGMPQLQGALLRRSCLHQLYLLTTSTEFSV